MDADNQAQAQAQGVGDQVVHPMEIEQPPAAQELNIDAIWDSKFWKLVVSICLLILIIVAWTTRSKPQHSDEFPLRTENFTLKAFKIDPANMTVTMSLHYALVTNNLTSLQANINLTSAEQFMQLDSVTLFKKQHLPAPVPLLTGEVRWNSEIEETKEYNAEDMKIIYSEIQDNRFTVQIVIEGVAGSLTIVDIVCPVEITLPDTVSKYLPCNKLK